MNKKSERIEFKLRIFAIKFLLVSLIIFNSILHKIPGISTILPQLIVMLSFYFAIYNSSMISTIYLLTLCFLTDLLQGLPVGLTAVVLLPLRAILINQKNLLLSRPFSIIWLVFMSYNAAFMLLYVFMLRVVLDIPISTDIILTQLLFSFFTYAIVHVVFGKINSLLPSHRWA
jgi:hypothetical protein